MNDKQDEKIIELFWSRDESAIREAEAKYRGFAHSVLYNLLSMKEDREECLNDALLALWNNIPPERPGGRRGALYGTCQQPAGDLAGREQFDSIGGYGFL